MEARRRRLAEDLLSGSEDSFVARLAALVGAAGAHRGVVGIGDDAAVLPGAPPTVLTIDLLVEGQHFRLDYLSPEQLAVRALEANLSDVAAMGARPTGVFLGLAWPAEAKARRAAGRFVHAFARAAAERGAPLLGGDTVKAAAGAATIAVAVTGTPWPGGPVFRGGGRPGDLLAVSGPLGAWRAGLALLAGERPRPRDKALAARALAAYRTPRGRLDLAKALAKRARAMMDLSDGLGLDLPRLADASRCGFVVEAAAVPVDEAARAVARDEAEALGWALAGGEDYELLFAVAPADAAATRRALARVGGALHVVGRLLPPGGGRWLERDGRRTPWRRAGWDPFAAQGLGAGSSPRGGRPRPGGRLLSGNGLDAEAGRRVETKRPPSPKPRWTAKRS
ncbi:MAG: thiamine-phosphate kinase [Candidatus Polarisedimenticolia bacterium]